MEKAVKSIIFCVAILIFTTNGVVSQHLGSRASLFTIENGLSQTGINCVFHDSKGYLWLGTEDGLDRYDGNSFQVFRHQPEDSNSICDNYIRHICESGDGNLWIATNNGLSRFDSKTGHFSNFYNDPDNPNSISDNSLYSVYEDKEGFIWVKTLQSLEKFNKDKNQFIHYFHYNNVFTYISGDFYFPINEDKNGKLWIGTKDGLNCFDKNLELFERFHHNPNDNSTISDDRIKVLCFDKSGNLWVGTEYGLNLYNKANHTFRRFTNIPNNSNSLVDNNVDEIYCDNNGLLWIGTENGFCTLNTNNYNFTQYKYLYINNIKLSITGITSILKDNSNLLWLGTYQGLVKIDLKPFKFNIYRDSEDGLSSTTADNISSVYADEKKRIWLGSWGEGLTIYNRVTKSKNTYTAQNSSNFIKNNNIFVIYPDKDSRIWVGTGSGIFIYNTKSGSFTDFKNICNDNTFLENNRVNAILQIYNGDIWIGTDHGLHIFHPKNNTIDKYISLPDSQGIQFKSVFCLTQDSSHNIWIGTGIGLIKYNKEKKVFKKYHSNNKININSLSSNFIYSLLTTSKNNIWIGTNSGLCKYNKQYDNFSIYTEKDGLPNSFIYSILEDSKNNLWLSTNHGIVKYDINLDQFQDFDLADGLQSYEFNVSSAYKSKNGELFFGGINGLNYFNPDSLKTNNSKPNIEITSVELIGKGSLKRIPVWPDKDIIVPPFTNLINISFAVLDFTYPENNQFKYMLSQKGKESIWIDIGNRHTQTFSNLPTGEYTFKVKGANSNDIWSDKEYSINLIVESPLWKTKLAISIYIIVLALIIYISVQLRTRKLRHSNKQLIEKEHAAKEIAKQKEELTIKNKNITDSINYAKRIQISMMPSERTFRRILPNSFVYHKPRDIVSGDFYWIYERLGKTFVAAVDCTGHGVPGAFMSILGVELFRRITQEQIDEPGIILSRLNEEFSKIFSDIDDISLKDGMDISFCVIDKQNYSLKYAGAFNPLYLIRDNKLEEIKGNRFSVSMEKKIEELVFETHEVKLQKGDMLYIFSDGYADQFGGYEGKKFKYRRFRHLLLSLNKLPLENQKIYLDESMESWRGNNEQVDDLLVIGIRADFDKLNI